MSTHDDYCVVITTCPDEAKARGLAESIVEKRLGACAQIDAITSYYRWEGAVSRDVEWRLTIKTRGSKVDALRNHIREAHDYTVPEFIVLPITEGSAAYLDWIRESTVDED